MSMAKTAKARTMADRIEEMHKARVHNRAGGGEDKLQKQRDKGKMTARERLDALLDEGTFQEIGLFRKNRTVTFGMDKADMPADGVVTGTGAVFGRPIHVASQDFTVMGGSAGETHSVARVQEGIDSLSGYGQVFYANVKLSGAVPQVSIICGPCAGGAAYSPALTDFVIQTRKAHMFITGPNVIEQVTGEKVTQDGLGGADTHMAISGVNHFVADDDAQAILIAKKLLSFLPSNNTEDAPIVDPDPYVEPDETMCDLVPPEGTKGYDVRTVIGRLVDHSDFLEVQAGYAMNIVVGFARINGRGVVASQPNVMAGVLDINASDKGSKFIRFCNAFNIPIVTLVDVPGFLPGVAQEHGGIIRHGAKMLYAYAAATVPKITVVLRKAYGGAYIAMACKDLGADQVFAWPTAEIAVMGAEGAASVVFKREIDAAEDPDARRQELVDEYRETFSTPFVAASRGLVDDIINPADTRRKVAMALELLVNKRELRPAKKHGLGPV